MKLSINKIITLLILFIISIFSIVLFFKEKKEFSPNENRYLKTKVEFSIERLLNKKFISDFENLLTDQFPLRDNFINIKTSVDKILGKDDQQGVYFSKNGYLIEKYNKHKNNDKLINKLNKFTSEVNYVNFNLMLVPTGVTINYNLLPKNAITYNQMDTIKYIYDNINFDTINLYDTFNEHKDDYQLFYKLDHHWTSYGAYYAYSEYCNHNNITPIKLGHFDIEEVSNNFYGTLYSKTGDYFKKPDSIHKFSYGNPKLDVEYVYEKKITHSLYEEKYLNEKDKYSYFLDNNHPLIIITNNDIKNNNELIIIKDSYANTFVPFLVNHYKKIHIIDPRFYKMSIIEYIKDNKSIKDGLFLYNVNTIDNDTGIFSIR